MALTEKERFQLLVTYRPASFFRHASLFIGQLGSQTSQPYPNINEIRMAKYV